MLFKCGTGRMQMKFADSSQDFIDERKHTSDWMPTTGKHEAFFQLPSGCSEEDISRSLSKYKGSHWNLCFL